MVFDSKLNWKENINSVLKKVNSRIYCMRKLRSFGVNSDMFGSVCWGGNISKLDRGRLEKIVKKQVMLWESHWTVLRLCTKRDCTVKLMQILNDPTHPMRHYFATTGVKDFYFREQIQTGTKPRFYPRLCQFLMKIIPVIK